MTNLTATIIFTLSTNWHTVSVTIPSFEANANGTTLTVIRYNTENQVGKVFSNTVAQVLWKGKTNEVILESVELPITDVKREILSSPGNMLIK